MINAYYVSEVGIDQRSGCLWGTNHGNEPFEGAVHIPLTSIVGMSTRYVGRHNVQHRNWLGHGFSDERLVGSTEDTWICDVALRNGDHIWLYDNSITIADQALDAWLDHRRAL